MAEQGKKIYTVRGAIDSSDFGRTLIHEHILVDFIGAAQISRDRYRQADVVTALMPYLMKVKEQGFGAFVECTPQFIGRDPLLLRQLSEKTGMHFVTNTGLYAAGEREGSPEPYLPEYAYELSPELLAGGWLKEWYEGIEGTGIRPGFIKIGVNRAPLRPISEKIVRAAAMASRQSGLVIACHTGRGEGAVRILDLLEEEQVAPDRYIFVHAQGEVDSNYHLECAKRGAWIGLDGVNPTKVDRHLELVLLLLEQGFEDQILLSQDAGWYRPGEPEGGKIRGYDYLYSEFVPKLIASGVPEATVEHLLVHNPRRVLEM